MSEPQYKVKIGKTASLVGLYANAFRVVEDPDTPSDCFLDFLLTSPVEKAAYVVTRVRLRKEFLSEVASHLAKNFSLDLLKRIKSDQVH